MGEGGKWVERFRHTIALSPEPLPGLPLVEIAGERRVLIENHRGVIGYSREEIQVRVSYGKIAVSGSCLELNRMSREVLVITGNIYCVALHREGSRC